jgi:hypothetical protein
MQISDLGAVLRLIVCPHLERGGFHVDRFDAYLDGELIVTSRQPLLDGARRLLQRGFDPEALLTMRMHNRPYDSFPPSRSESGRGGPSPSVTEVACSGRGGSRSEVPFPLPRSTQGAPTMPWW